MINSAILSRKSNPTSTRIILMNITNENNRLVKWPTLAKQLKKEGLIIKEGRPNNYRYCQILRISA